MVKLFSTSPYIVLGAGLIGPFYTTPVYTFPCHAIHNQIVDVRADRHLVVTLRLKTNQANCMRILGRFYP